jgi:hypothetical protein
MANMMCVSLMSAESIGRTLGLGTKILSRIPTAEDRQRERPFAAFGISGQHEVDAVPGLVDVEVVVRLCVPIVGIQSAAAKHATMPIAEVSWGAKAAFSGAGPRGLAETYDVPGVRRNRQ